MCLVSVCMITYNHQDYVEEAIKGFLSQDVPYGIELVISDDCSQDNTFEICKKYEKMYSNIRLYSTGKNIGVIGNLVFALNKCIGKYVALCEGDDYWTSPSKIARQVFFLEYNDEYILSFHNSYVLKDGYLSNNKLRLDGRHEYYFTDLVDGNFISTPTALFRSSCLEDLCRKIDTDGFYLGDYLLWVYLSQYGKFYKFDDCMAVYRVHSGGVWSNKKDIYKKITFIKTIKVALSVLHRKEYLSILNRKYIIFTVRCMVENIICGSISAFFKFSIFFIDDLLCFLKKQMKD